LEKKYEGKVKVTKIDPSKNRWLCLNLKVLGLPTFLLYKNGKELDRLTGGDVTIKNIDQSVNDLLG
jgi:thioredoxin 1